MIASIVDIANQTTSAHILYLTAAHELKPHYWRILGYFVNQKPIYEAINVNISEHGWDSTVAGDLLIGEMLANEFRVCRVIGCGP